MVIIKHARQLTCSLKGISSSGTIASYSTGSQSLSYDRVRQIRNENLNRALITYYNEPILMEKGEKQYMWDHNGKKYLDLFAGIVTVSVGHCHPYVNEKLIAQINKLWHTTSIYMTSPMHEYAEKLIATLPNELEVCYFVNSGSEANDLALLMSRVYTGRYDVISLRNAYHGLTQSLVGATNIAAWKPPAPTGLGIYKVMNPDPYRGYWGGKNCRDSISQTNRDCNCKPDECHACNMYIDQLDECLRHDVPAQGPAAMIIESIQGVGGVIQFPRKYVQTAFDMIRAKGGLCISDEVQAGFGRTGDNMWGFQNHGVVPDIVTMAKGIANGFPMAAIVTTKKVATALTKALHLNTYGGNPMACTAASATLDVIQNEHLQANCKTVGTYFIEELMKLRDSKSSIGDVRGKGLMIGVELVSDKNARIPLERVKVQEYFEKIRDHGILIGVGGANGNIFRIKPPMIITKSDVDQAITVFNDVLA